eukprot:scaffold7385_cov533-Prasinococcus_capsulatus_cf.AAC.2
MVTQRSDPAPVRRVASCGGFEVAYTARVRALASITSGRAGCRPRALKYNMYGVAPSQRWRARPKRRRGKAMSIRPPTCRKQAWLVSVCCSVVSDGRRWRP